MKKDFTIIPLLAFILLTTSLQATVRYVKPTGSDANTGLSWAQAYASIQQAINVSVAGDEIWVAAGTYKPTLDPFGNANPANPRDRTFYLKNGVKLYGGFAGTETMLSERDWVANLTILSGDFNGDDAGFTNNGENAYHVVLSVSDGAATEINGFTIKGGNGADAGALTVEGFPQVFRSQGGGLGSFISSPTVLHCVFSGNRSIFGGGVSNFGSGGLFGECTFSGNTVFTATGGGMENNSSSPVIRNCLFSGNFANNGGGMRNISSSSPTITNCTFSGNNGGALTNFGSSTPTLKNCIIWGNSSSIVGTPTVTYSIVQGGYAGTGNLDVNPGFVNQPNFASAPTIAGDLHLTACSAALNVGTNTGAPANDLDGNARPFGATVDMGAYEFQGSVQGRPTGVLTGSATICPGGSASLSINVTGTGPWSGALSDGTTFSNQNTNPVIVPVSPASTTTYTLTALSDVNCSAMPADRTGSATVTVPGGNNNTPPSITCPTSVPALTANGNCQALLGDYVGLANFTGSCVEQMPAPGTVVNPGTVAVRLTAFNGAGQQAACVFNVSITGGCGGN